jgi:D-xylose transport system permease protein
MIILLILYLATAQFADITAAALYALTDNPSVELLRIGREVFAVLLAAVGFFATRLPPAFRVLTLLYLSVIFLYTAYGLTDDPSLMLLLASAEKLALPLILMHAGMAGVRSLRDLKILCGFIILFGTASALFGLWDIGNTEFWTDRLDYGRFLYEVKGVLNGFNVEFDLPHNFFGYEYARRAAGLVAAPLAQGSFLFTAAILAFALLRNRSVLLAAGLTVFLCYGVYQSGTRGAFIMVLIGLPIFALIASQRISSSLRDLLTVGILLAAGLETILYIASYTVNLDDGSTIGHVEALQSNFADLGDVLLLGEGIGNAGSVTSALDEEIAGGGESSFFSVTYQIGLPGGVLFLAIIGLIALYFWRWRSDPEIGTAAAAGFALTAGAASSLIISEHLLAVSAMAPFWLTAGGILALIGRRHGLARP